MIVADKTYKHEVDDKMSNLPFRQCLLKDLHLISDNISTYIMIAYSINTMILVKNQNRGIKIWWFLVMYIWILLHNCFIKLDRIHQITLLTKLFFAKYTWYSKLRVYLKLLIQLQHCWKAKSNFKLFSQTASTIYEQKFDLCDVLSTWINGSF